MPLIYCYMIVYWFHIVTIKRNGNLAQQNQCIYSDRYFNTTDSLKDVFLKDNIPVSAPAVITNWLMVVNNKQKPSHKEYDNTLRTTSSVKGNNIKGFFLCIFLPVE
jgi:hypothetical protein